MNEKIRKSLKISIILILSDATKSCMLQKELRKSCFKSVKNDYDDEIIDKKEMKKCFKDVLERLLEKEKVRIEDDNVILNKKAKRKIDDVEEEIDIEKEDKKSRKEKKEKKDKKEKNISIEKDEKTTINDSKLKESIIETETTESAFEQKIYPVIVQDLTHTILLFYAYCTPVMTQHEVDTAVAKCYAKLLELECGGRLRIGQEGFNCTMTGKTDKIREFTKFLKEFDKKTFANTDFKYVDKQPANQLLKGLKVWAVKEIVTYGFDPRDAPLEMTGNHLTPIEFHKALTNPNSIVIDVRNFNESLIGKFAPPGGIDKVLDPCMRKSTEFPKWIQDNKHKLENKQVLMYCTAGVRCERASAFMRNQGIQNVNQLEGGIHRYLDAFPEDGGHWIGKNYTFDKRFNHGSEKSEIISNCVNCKLPWARYQAQLKCKKCQMEVIVCKDCTRIKPAIKKDTLFCPLCKKA